jgi:hypothetical protein
MPTIVWKGNPALFTAGVNTVLVEQPDSPLYTFDDLPTCVRRYRGLHSLCLSSGLYKGTLGTGAMAGWIVKKSTIKREAKQIGELTIDWQMLATAGESGSLQLPADEFDLQPFEVNPKTEQHPFFSALDDEKRVAVRTVVDSEATKDRATKLAALDSLSLNLAQKLMKGRDSYYLAGWTYTWTTYSWDLPTAMAGGVIEAPAGPLAGYFVGTIDWLRQADSLQPTPTHFKLTKTWLGGPNGHWDTDLYA